MQTHLNLNISQPHYSTLLTPFGIYREHFGPFNYNKCLSLGTVVFTKIRMDIFPPIVIRRLKMQYCLVMTSLVKKWENRTPPGSYNHANLWCDVLCLLNTKLATCAHSMKRASHLIRLTQAQDEHTKVGLNYWGQISNDHK